MELETQKTREELARKEKEKAEKARIAGDGKREVAVPVEIIRRSKENRARPVTRDREDGDLRMMD